MKNNIPSRAPGLEAGENLFHIDMLSDETPDEINLFGVVGTGLHEHVMD